MKACQAATIVLLAGLATPASAKDRPSARELWARIEAAHAASGLDVPHRLVAEVVWSSGSEEPDVAIIRRTWWSDDAWREEVGGSRGSSVSARDGEDGWQAGDLDAGAMTVRWMLERLAPPPEVPVLRHAGAHPDGIECLDWRAAKSREWRTTCVRDGVLVSQELAGRRVELAGHAPFGDRRVARAWTLKRLDREEARVRIRELEPLVAKPEGLLSGRPPHAVPLDPPCDDITAPVARIKVEPVWPPGDPVLERGGSIVLRAVVGDDGDVQPPEILQSSGSTLMDRAAERAYQSWKYAPAIYCGHPQAVYVKMTFRF